MANFYIGVINEIIQYGLDNNFMNFKVLMSKTQNYVEVNIDNQVHRCSMEEWNFINNAIRIQRYKN
ncbi:hypothetical protein BCJMU51_5464 [Bacillus cereus]|nr:hypothetical protein BCJMU51_5464 [Bacillus cereus]